MEAEEKSRVIFLKKFPSAQKALVSVGAGVVLLERTRTFLFQVRKLNICSLHNPVGMHINFFEHFQIRLSLKCLSCNRDNKNKHHSQLSFWYLRWLDRFTTSTHVLSNMKENTSPQKKQCKHSIIPESQKVIVRYCWDLVNLEKKKNFSHGQGSLHLPPLLNLMQGKTLI